MIVQILRLQSKYRAPKRVTMFFDKIIITYLLSISFQKIDNKWPNTDEPQ